MKCAIVIPARMGSTRFPGKPLVDLLGKPMVQRVYEAATTSGVADRVIIATPDQEIIDACAAFGAEAMLTRLDHPSGTDRIAEVAESVDADVFVNVQGDEPLLPSASIASCARPLLEDASIQMSSCYCTCEGSEIDNPAVVKVVTDINDFALYFSRFALPYERNSRPLPVKKHLGLYAYRREAVMAFSNWPVAPLEAAESLEQLRFLYHGVRIKMVEAAGAEMAIDTPEQAEEVRRILSSR